jgi:hypothetical protein
MQGEESPVYRLLLQENTQPLMLAANQQFPQSPVIRLISTGNLGHTRPYFPAVQTLPGRTGQFPAQTLPSPVEVVGDEAKAPYVPGGSKRPYLRGPSPPYLLLDPEGVEKVALDTGAGGHITIQQGPLGVQTLPSPIVFADGDKTPYLPGGDKRPYLRGPSPSYLLLDSEGEGAQEKAPYVPGGDKRPYLRGPSPSYLLLDSDVEGVQGKAPYVPGGDKRPYLRGPVTPTYLLLNPRAANALPAAAQPAATVAADREAEHRYVLLAPAATRPFNPALNTRPFNGVAAQTLSSPIVFAAQSSPQINLQAGGVQTLPNPIVFDEEGKAPNVPGGDKRPYLRGPSSSPSYLLLEPEGEVTLPLDQPSPQINLQAGGVQTLPSPIVYAEDTKTPYVPGESKVPYLRGRLAGAVDPRLRARAGPLPGAATRPSFPPGFQFPARAAQGPRTAQGPSPGASTRPSFPPGYTPVVARAATQTFAAAEAYWPNFPYAPKTVIYVV